MGTIGNVLSYLRLAAVGLASAHLAAVANELATLGPIWLGVSLPASSLTRISPSPRSARRSRRCDCITVEFFGAFLVGGGRASALWGAPGRPLHPRKEQTWRPD